MKIKLLAYGIITLPFSSFAEVKGKVNVEEKLQVAIDKIEVLKAQLILMEKYNSDILSTVHWSLAGLLTLGIFIVGFSWFSNFRIYERDKDSLKKELRSHMDLEFEKLKGKLELTTSELSSNIEETVAQNVKPKLSSIKDKIKELEEDFFDDILDLKIQNKKTERNHWLETEVFTNAYRTSVDILEFCVDKKYDWDVHEPLDLMLEDLKSMVKAGDALDSEDIQESMKILNKVSSEHEITKHAILETISKMKKA